MAFRPWGCVGNYKLEVVFHSTISGIHIANREQDNSLVLAIQRNLTMKLLCLDLPQPGASPDKYQPHLLDEVRHTWEVYKSGIVRDIYFRQDRPGVVIVAECDSVETAREALREFPLARAGLIDWDVIPVGPFVNWEMLFAHDDV
jgi:hypothetical protein